MKNDNMNEWREHPDFIGLYHISDIGEIKSIPKRNKNCNRKQERLLNPINRKDGYLGITLCKNGVRKSYLIHRLVAETFIPNPENKPEVNHKNGFKSDNRVENLEWVDRSENQKHAVKIGLKIMRKGEDHSDATISNKVALEIFNSNLNIDELIKTYNVSYNIIRKIKNGQSWNTITKKEYLPKKRLTNKEVEEIYLSKLPKNKICVIYNVSKSQVNSIKAGRCWDVITKNIKNAI